MFQRIINVLVTKPLCPSFAVPIGPTCFHPTERLWPFPSFRPLPCSLPGPTLLSRALGRERLNGPLGPLGGLLPKVGPPVSRGLEGLSLGSRIPTVREPLF